MVYYRGDAQASPIGMASASQADFGGSDSRRLLQRKKELSLRGFFFVTATV